MTSHCLLFINEVLAAKSLFYFNVWLQLRLLSSFISGRWYWCL